MHVLNVKAESNASGGQIDLAWVNPAALDFPDFKGVKILRREAAFPTIEEIKKQPAIFLDVETRAGETGRFSDTNLESEKTYYYAVASFDANATPTYYPVFVSALSTAAYGTGDQLYKNLPALYQRFDSIKPPVVPQLDARDLDKGQLRRFIEMFGAQFDLLRSYTSAMRDFSDIERIDGALLPLLAQWIGWQTDYSLPVSKQRNEIKYAPHFYRTTGIAASLRATLNRLTTWDAQIKEFVHNVLLTNNPEQLALREAVHRGDTLQAARLATLDVAYEGKPAAIFENEKRQWLFYHARQSVPEERAKKGASLNASLSTPNTASATSERRAARDTFQLWFKLCQDGEWLPAQRLTDGGGINKHPAVVRRQSDGNFLVFYDNIDPNAPDVPAQIKLILLAAGRPAQHARITGTKHEPFALADGDQLTLKINDGLTTHTKTITFHREDFYDLARVSVSDLAAFLNAELAGVAASGDADGALVLSTLNAGAGAAIVLENGNALAKLGLAGQSSGLEAKAAQVSGSLAEPFNLREGDTLTFKLDGKLPQTINFKRQSFGDIGRARAAEVAAVIKRLAPGVAQQQDGKLILNSRTSGAASSITIDVSDSTAAAKLGFSVAPPLSTPAFAESEPAAFEDASGGVWLFWRSRRAGSTGGRIWFNRFDGKAWGEAKGLTDGAMAERQPCVIYDASASGKIWVFWNRRKDDGRWRICYRTTASENRFDALTDADWLERELAHVAQANYDDQEPAAVLVDGDHARLYFSSNRASGLHLWTKVVSSSGAAKDAQLTFGQWSYRAPAALRLDAQNVKLWFRSNESQTYNSSLYPTSRTTDARYAGSTLLDTTNPAKFGVRGTFQDALHYTYDTRKGNENWYARDTVGIYLTPDTDDEALIVRKREQIASLLKKFLPMQVRAVLIIQQVFPEIVYTYDHATANPQIHIVEHAFETALGEVYRGLSDSRHDRANFHWMRTWERGASGGVLPDTQTQPPDVSTRLPHTDVEEGD